MAVRESRYQWLKHLLPSRPRAILTGLFVIHLLVPGLAVSGPAILGLGLHPAEGRFLADEWRWAWRGGGADARLLSSQELRRPPADLKLIVLDSVPLSSAEVFGLDQWVRNGGLLLYAGADTAFTQRGGQRHGKDKPGAGAATLLGARYAGRDPGLIGTYPAITATSPLLAPLMAGDGLRLGNKGIGHSIRIEPSDADVLAESIRLSPGPGGMAVRSDAASILSRRHGSGRVVFLTFSPARIAACYPDLGDSRDAVDCGGAASARALMRWLTVNLLWEEKRIQLPLRWESPDDRPHGVIITGDVHSMHRPKLITTDMPYTFLMANMAARLGVPMSFYLDGHVSFDRKRKPDQLRALADLEISTHGLDGTPFESKHFYFSGRLGMARDLREAEELLGIPAFPKQRPWRLSLRNHGWISDRSAWRAMHQAGIGVVFDLIADSLSHRAPWRVPNSWYAGGEQQRLFIPTFERSVATGAADFRLEPDEALNMALVASAEPEPVANAIPYADYARYVGRWHDLFERLAPSGGLLEVWLWHPQGLFDHKAWDQVEAQLRGFRDEPAVNFWRGDVLSNWYANRERLTIHVERDGDAQLRAMDLQAPSSTFYPLPPGAPPAAANVGYWVLGSAQFPGWRAREWRDAAGRTVTVLTRPIDLPQP